MTALPAIRIEGGLLGPEVVDGDLPGQKPADFGLDGRRSLTDEIAAIFADSRKLWEVFQHRLQRLPEGDLATSVTRDAWAIPFFGLLGIEARYNPRAHEVDGMSLAISHRMGEPDDSPPLHIVGARQELGRMPASGRLRLAPHSLLQEYLNRTEHLWGMVTNGLTLRLLRNSKFIRRQVYIEFDLQTLLEEQRFNDFAALYRLLHRTRFPRGLADAGDCLLERYYQQSLEQGGRVREHLRDGVEECIKRLGNGFLANTANQHLRRRIMPGYSDADRIEPQEFYRQLLRLVYRFLFLLVSEDRGLISPNPLYREHYGVGRLRRLLDSQSAYNDHDDIWHSLRVLWKVLSDDRFAPLLEVAPLNGELFAPLTLDNCAITNRDLLSAFWHLAFYQEGSAPPRRVNYAALDTEELGSVYESLLDYHPQVDSSGAIPRFDLAPGSERKSTGSYYTPPELVTELIGSALEPVIEERLKAARTPGEKERAVLSIRVCDPACGSGHFLLAAARHLGKKLARLRTGEDEPAPERVREAIREVVAHCLYGVDKNPLAVELCRVALWLEAHCEGKPLTFLDHRIRCGDSLVGVMDLTMLKKGIPAEAFEPVTGDDRQVARSLKKRNQSERTGQRVLDFDSATESEPAQESLRVLLETPDDTPAQIHRKAQALQEWEQKTERLRMACHLWTAAFFQKLVSSEWRIEKAQKPFAISHSPSAISHSPFAFITTETVRGYLESGTAHGQALGIAETLAQENHFFHWPLEFPEVFGRIADGEWQMEEEAEQPLPIRHLPSAESVGFDVVIGNPPFMGGLKISGNLGDKYRHWLEVLYDPYGGTADLCATFYRRAYSLLKLGARMGMVATNTIGQGDTRESGLAVILREGGTITFAKRFVKWTGAANVEVNLATIYKPDRSSPAIRHSPILDNQPVDLISSRLDAELEAEPVRLKQNEGKAFIGDYVRGIGFVLEPQEAERLLAQDSRNADCLFPYLNGEDLNSHPEQQPSRWVICFHDWDLERAKRYPDLLRIVEERVKFERERLRGPGDKRNREYWWQFGAYRAGMRQAIAPLRRVLVRSRVSELHMLAFVPKGYVYGDATVVFAFDDDYHFALLQSGVHEVWVWRNASSLESRNRYTPTDCFDTFPFPPLEYERLASGKWQLEEMPQAFQQAAQVGEEYHEHRRQIMLARQLGLTKTYNLFHNPACQDADIVRLRGLHAEMDRAILACYGWEDLEPSHNFYQNDRGQTRYTISPEARRKVLARLVGLNEKIAKGEF
jgi:hypothetical protein